MKIIPKKTQWRRWTLPSKAGYVGMWVGILVGVPALIFSLWPSKPTINQTNYGSGNIQAVTTAKNSPIVIDKRSFFDSRRVITSAQRTALVNRVSSFSKIRVRYLTVSDSEANSFSKQIRKALEDGGWLTEEDVIHLGIYFTGVVLYGSEDPPAPAINTLYRSLKEFGFNPRLIKDTELPRNVFSVKVGTKAKGGVSR